MIRIRLPWKSAEAKENLMRQRMLHHEVYEELKRRAANELQYAPREGDKDEQC